MLTNPPYWIVQAAIKMLTKLVEKQTPGSMSQHLGDIMPGLLKAYDNVESSVRKAAVFCIVALHQLVGEATLQVRSTRLQSCGSGIIYSGSGSSYELRVPDPDSDPTHII